MRALVAICSFFIMVSVGCGGTEQVTFTDEKGKSAGVLDMDIRHVDQMRKGELDLTTHAIVYGSGYLVDCGSARDPYAGEITGYRSFFYGGDCVAMGAIVPPSGTNTYAFDFTESFATWVSDGSTLNNTMKSAKVRAQSGVGTQTAWMRDVGGNGWGHYRHVAAGTTHLFPSFQSATQCPAGSDCAHAPTQTTSFLGMFYQ